MAVIQFLLQMRWDGASRGAPLAPMPVALRDKDASPGHSQVVRCGACDTQQRRDRAWRAQRNQLTNESSSMTCAPPPIGRRLNLPLICTFTCRAAAPTRLPVAGQVSAAGCACHRRRFTCRAQFSIHATGGSLHASWTGKCLCESQHLTSATV